MTRRERHIRIMESWGLGSHNVKWETDGMLAKMGLDAFTDEAIEEIATRLVRSRRFQAKLNHENKLRRAVAR